MKIQIGLTILSAACLFVGCATTYQPVGFTGGYTDQRLDDNTVQVSFRGNGFTAPETVHTYLLRRCAELTLQDGYNYFVLVDAEEPNEGNTNVYGAKLNSKFRATTTIKMFRGRKPEADVRAYDAASVIRNIPVSGDEGVAPSVAANDSQAVAPPVVTTTQPSSNVASTTSQSNTLLPAANPNALTNQPTSFDHW
jgi:hypothetical protein